MKKRTEETPLPVLDRFGRLPDAWGNEVPEADALERLYAAAEGEEVPEDEALPEGAVSLEEATSLPGFHSWIEEAVDGLSFPPDRKRVRQELTDHYLDRRDELHARGLSWWDAELAAVEALGDPVETGRLLRAVHKPWLGWLLRLARVLLFAVLLIGLIHVSDLNHYISGQISLRKELAQYEDPRAYFAAQTPAAVEVGRSGAEVQLGDYRISVFAAGNCPVVRRIDDAPYAPTVVYAVLRFAAPPWRRASEADFRFWVEDELGCVYLTDYTAWDLPLSAANRVGMLTENERYNKLDLRYMGQDLTAGYYLLEIYNSYNEGYSGAKHMEIHILMGLEELVFPVTFGPRELIGDLFSAPPEDVSAAAEAMLEPLTEDGQTEVRYLREGTADPIPRGDCEAWVPCAREALWYHTNLTAIPWDREQTAKGVWSWQPTEDLQRFDMDVTACHAQLEFVLALRGPSEKLPLTNAELLSRLSLTGTDGTVYPLEALPETMGNSDDSLVNVWLDRYQDLVLYDVTLVIDSPSEVFDLTLALDGETVPLQIVMGEEAMP